MLTPSIGFLEILVIAVIALIVVGPKDLPLMARKVGKFVGQVKSMGREFKDAFDEMGREAELDELRKEIEAIKQQQALKEVEETLKETDAETRKAIRGQ